MSSQQLDRNKGYLRVCKRKQHAWKTSAACCLQTACFENECSLQPAGSAGPGQKAQRCAYTQRQLMHELTNSHITDHNSDGQVTNAGGICAQAHKLTHHKSQMQVVFVRKLTNSQITNHKCRWYLCANSQITNNGSQTGRRIQKDKSQMQVVFVRKLTNKSQITNAGGICAQAHKQITNHKCRWYLCASSLTHKSQITNAGGICAPTHKSQITDHKQADRYRRASHKCKWYLCASSQTHTSQITNAGGICAQTHKSQITDHKQTGRQIQADNSQMQVVFVAKLTNSQITNGQTDTDGQIADVGGVCGQTHKLTNHKHRWEA